MFTCSLHEHTGNEITEIRQTGIHKLHTTTHNTD